MPTDIGGPATCDALIDPAVGGYIRVGPVRGIGRRARRLPPGRQAYRPGTMVVETEMWTGTGRRVLVTDFFPWTGTADPPVGRIVRLVRALAGPVDVEVEVRPGTAFGAARRLRPTSEGLRWDRTLLRTGFPLDVVADAGDRPVWLGVQRLDTDQELVVTLDVADVDRHGPLSPDAARRLADDTADAWRGWLADVRGEGPYRPTVERALLAVRSMTDPLVGAPRGAGTTSLPRRAGGERTADERSIRLADAGAAAVTLARVGLAEDAEAAEAWLRRAVEDAPPPWPGALLPDGQPVPEVEELRLAGRLRSQPVVTGRPAGLVDLGLAADVFAAVSASTAGSEGDDDVDALRRRPPGPLQAGWPALADGADWLVDHWDEPDTGRWELAGRPRRLVASRVGAWWALDRAARLARTANPLDLAAPGWQQAAAGVLTWLEARGMAADGGLRADPSPDDRPDAALLRVAWRGPWPTAHPLVAATVDRVIDRLGSGAFIHRSPADVDDGRAGADDPDLLASAWAVRALTVLGRWPEAHERMEHLVTAGGPLGLWSATIEPLSGAGGGDLPTTAVHLALVDATLALDRGPR